jgi:hypothetical protein
MKILYAVTITMVAWALVTSEGRAMEISLAPGFIHLPASSYHYLVYNARLGFGEKKGLFFAEFGMTPPFSVGTFTQTIYCGSLGWNWVSGKPSNNFQIRPYLGVGLGVYVDQVSSASGIVPALVTQGGIKLGGRDAGALIGFSYYLGTYSPSQLLNWTLWPLVNVMGGFYVSL